jgi:Fanconi anemia group M protein
MQEILKPNKIVVLSDDRERNSAVSNFLGEKDVAIKFIRLDVGDYIVSDRTCIERKSSDDFVNSIINGRIFQQMKEMKTNFEKPILIIEGKSFRERITENVLKATMSSIILEFGVPILITDDEKDTARMIYWLAKKEQEEFKRGIGIKGKKKPKEMKQLQEHIVASLPGVSTVLSKRLLGNFKSLKTLANASETELAKVKNIGEKQAKRLHRILNEKYEVD